VVLWLDSAEERFLFLPVVNPPPHTNWPSLRVGSPLTQVADPLQFQELMAVFSQEKYILNCKVSATLITDKACWGEIRSSGVLLCFGQAASHDKRASVYLLFHHDATSADVIRGYLHAYLARQELLAQGYGKDKIHGSAPHDLWHLDIVRSTQHMARQLAQGRCCAMVLSSKDNWPVFVKSVFVLVSTSSGRGWEFTCGI